MLIINENKCDKLRKMSQSFLNVWVDRFACVYRCEMYEKIEATGRIYIHNENRFVFYDVDLLYILTCDERCFMQLSI